MIDPHWEEWFGLIDHEARATLLDGEAMADPTKASAAEAEIGKLLCDLLGHRPHQLTKSSRWLLGACGHDKDGLRRCFLPEKEPRLLAAM